MRTRPSQRVRLWICGFLALGVHAGLFFGWRSIAEVHPVATLDGPSMEVELVAGPTADESEPESAPPSPMPATPVPAPAEPPAPGPVELPEPEAPAPASPDRMESAEAIEQAKTQKPKPPALHPPSRREPAGAHQGLSGPAHPPAGARENGGSAPAGVGHGSAGRGAPSGKPAFLIPPEPSYPAESRAAKEEGVVTLRIVVDGSGRPTSVTVAHSSGFPRLDRAAVQGGWRSRVGNASAGAEFNAPVRFSLRN